MEVEEFLLGCLRLRGQARAMDIAKLASDQKWMIKSQGRPAPKKSKAVCQKLPRHSLECRQDAKVVLSSVLTMRKTDHALYQ